MKLIKTLLILVVVIVVLAVGGVAAFIGFADPNDFKGLIADKVREATGRELTIAGNLEWGFYPKLRLHTGAVSLSNAPGFGDEPFFAADEISIAVATLPLLSKRLEMDTVVLQGIALNLQKNDAGTSNWDDLASGEAAEDDSGGGLATIILGGVDVGNGRVSWTDASTGQNVEITNITAKTGALTFGDPVDFALSLTANANQPALDSDVSLTGTVSYDLDNEHYVISPLRLATLLRGKHLPDGKAEVNFGAVVDLNMDKGVVRISELALDGLDTTLAGDFLATEVNSDKPSAAGQLNLAGKDLAAVFNAFQLPVGRQLAGIPDRAFNFDVGFDANMDSGEVVVSQLEGKMLGASLNGSFNATDAHTDKMRASGKLEAGGPDLPTLLAVVGQLQGADADTLKSLDQALKSTRDKSFSIKADLEANLADGKAALPTLEAKLLGNTISGQLNATNADSDKPAVSGKLRASGPDFPTLLTAVATLQGADADTIKGLNAGLKGAADKSFEVVADIDADMARGTASLPTLNAKLLGNTITGKLDASNINDEKPAARGTLTASGADLPALLAIASQFQQDGKALRDLGAGLAKEKNRSFKVEIGFDTDLADGRMNLDKLAANLLGLSISGGLKGNGIDFEKNRGSLDGSIAVKADDLGPLLRSSGNADLAKSLKTLDLNAGIKGSLSDLAIAPLSLKTLVASPEVRKPVTLEIKAGEARANLDKDTLTLKDVSATGLGLNAKANVDVKQLSKEPAFSGKLNVPAFNLRQLLASLNKPVKTTDPKAMSKVSLSADFAGTPGSIRLDNLLVGLDDTTLKGDLNVRSFEGPDLTFGIGIDKINADRYMEPDSQGKAKKAATPEAAAAGAASELPVEMLRALKIKGDLLIGSLILSGAKLQDIKFAVRANNGLIKLAPVGASLYQGSYGGDIVLDARKKNTVMRLKTKLDKISVEPLIVDTTGNNMLAGVVSFDANLSGSGGSADRLKRTLNGKGSFETTNGIFRGVDAVAVLRAVEQIIECKCPVPIPKDGETRFSRLGGTLIAKNGIIRNNDLRLEGDGFIITGKGTFADLRNNTVKYNLELGVPESRAQAGVSQYNLGGYSVPIKCRGSLESPSCVPDAGGILKQVVKSQVKDKIGDKIKDAVGGDAGDALKKLFKF